MLCLKPWGWIRTLALELLGTSTSVTDVVMDTNYNPLEDRKKEELVAEDVSEMVWLRLQRLTSVTLCKKLISERFKGVESSLLDKKAEDLASSVRSALGYWHRGYTDLNARILSRYYGLLQLSIAEQVASRDPDNILERVQGRTQYGHGLFTVTDPNDLFPGAYNIGLLTRGYFLDYAKFNNIQFDDLVFEQRPRNWTDATSGARRSKIVSLSDLFRRVPELQYITREYLDQPPLSFHVAYSLLNATQRFPHHRDPEFYLGKSGPEVSEDENGQEETGIAIYRQDEEFSPEFLNALDLPITHITSENVPGQQWGPHFVGVIRHGVGTPWHQVLKPHYSRYCPPTIIAPLWKTIFDPLIINFLLLYGLSIIVRYLPDTWYRIQHGSLDHFRELLEHYFLVVDNVLPGLMYERITGVRLIIKRPF